MGAGGPKVGMSFAHADGGGPTETEVRALMKVLIGVDPLKTKVAVAAVEEAKGELLERATFLQNRAGLRALVHRQYRFRTVSYGKSHETTYLRTFVVGKGARAARSRIALQRHFHFAPFPDAPGEFEGG